MVELEDTTAATPSLENPAAIPEDKAEIEKSE